MKLRILTEDDVRSVLAMKDAIDVQAEAFRILSQGLSIAGLRSHALSEKPPGVAIFNPAFLKEGRGYGIKVVSDFYGNEKRGVPRMSAVVVLFDGETGHPRTVMEAGYLTDIRTGAGTGLAARYLARADSRTVAVIGAGRVARNQLEALCEVCRIEKVWVSTRTEARGKRFVEHMARSASPVPRDIEVVGPREQAVGEADIVVCATTSHDPVFPGSALKDGAFVVGAGTHQADMREVDSETIRRASKWVIDSRRDCLRDAGDLVLPMKEGILREDQVAEIPEVVAGRRPGRERDDEIIFYKSMGVPIQDLVTAQYVERRAVDKGIGTMVDIGGDHD